MSRFTELREYIRSCREWLRATRQEARRRKMLRDELKNWTEADFARYNAVVKVMGEWDPVGYDVLQAMLRQPEKFAEEIAAAEKEISKKVRLDTGKPKK